MTPTTGRPTTSPTAYPSSTPTTSMPSTSTPTTSLPTTSEPTLQPSLVPTTDVPTEEIGSSTTEETIDDADSMEQEQVVAPDQFWNSNPYTYIFYACIAFVAILLVAMATCGYCKLRNPKPNPDTMSYHFDITGQSTSSKKVRTMTIPIENIMKNSREP